MIIFVPVRNGDRQILLEFVTCLFRLPAISTHEHRLVFVPEAYAEHLAQAACAFLPAYPVGAYAEPRHAFKAPRDAWARCREAASNPVFGGKAWTMWEPSVLPSVPEWAYRLDACKERYYGNAEGTVQCFRFVPEPFADPTSDGYRTSGGYVSMDLATGKLEAAPAPAPAPVAEKKPAPTVEPSEPVKEEPPAPPREEPPAPPREEPPTSTAQAITRSAAPSWKDLKKK